MNDLFVFTPFLKNKSYITHVTQDIFYTTHKGNKKNILFFTHFLSTIEKKYVKKIKKNKILLYKSIEKNLCTPCSLEVKNEPTKD